jgi:hypothetical protein
MTFAGLPSQPQGSSKTSSIEGAGGGDESGLGDRAQTLVESWMSVDARTAIDSKGLEALASTAETGWMAEDAKLRFGARAIPAIIQSAKTHEEPYRDSDRATHRGRMREARRRATPTTTMLHVGRYGCRWRARKSWSSRNISSWAFFSARRPWAPARACPARVTRSPTGTTTRTASPRLLSGEVSVNMPTRLTSGAVHEGGNGLTKGTG